MSEVQKILFGNAERIYREYRDGSNVLTDPTNPLVSIYDPIGTFFDSGAPTKESTGVYYYSVSLSTASTTKEGIYQAYWQGTINSALITMDVPQYFQGYEVPWQEMQSDGIIRSIRRAIGDTNPDKYRLETRDLYYYLKDAVEEVQADYNFAYTITITNTSVTWNKTLYSTPFALFKLKTMIIVMEATMSDFLFDAGNVQLGDIKIDITGMMRIRLENLKRLQAKYDDLMYKIKMSTGGGHNIDTYATGLIENMADEVYRVYE